MIQLVDKSKCSGCYACYNACKANALHMIEDETGFWFPEIDIKSCVECGACTKACPALYNNKYQSKAPMAYIVQNKDDKIRLHSTSGGAFSGIAKQIIEKGGIVFGAAITSDYNVFHTYAETEKELAKFRGSKYVQSRIGNAYKEVRDFLESGREVCFSGTPCQVYGLKSYLKKDYNNLITVDVMCRAVPSPKILQKYIEYQKSNYPEFNRIVFRDKGKGYSYSCITLYNNNKVLYRGGSEYDPWLRLFFQGYCNRDSCHNCMYQSGVRASDITMWDCWDVQNYAPKWDDNKGTTNIIAWTKKGKDLIIHDNSNLKVKEIGIDNIDASLQRLPLDKADCDRNQFYEDSVKMDSVSFINKYAPITANVKIKKIARETIHALHLHDFIRKTIHKIRKRKKKG